MNRPLPLHDFTDSLALAESDTDLKHQLVRYLRTSSLSAPDSSPLTATTVLVMGWVVQQARSMYASGPERLLAAVSKSEEANALAVWTGPGRDWIVVSEGLMKLLRDRMEGLTNQLLAKFPDIVNTELMRRLLAQDPLAGGFCTSLSSFLYFAAITFITGHEAGHHIAGHESFYLGRAHAESSDCDELDQDGRSLIRQALELDADIHGLSFCRIAMTRLLTKLWGVTEAENLPVNEKVIFQRVLATLISTGALAAAVFIKPKKFEWADVRGVSHPPAVVRLLTLALLVSRAIKSSFPYVDTTSRRWIRLMSIEIAVGATILPGTEAYRTQQERDARGGEPSAIRATGVRKALYDRTLPRYMAGLFARIEEVRPLLKPRR